MRTFIATANDRELKFSSESHEASFRDFLGKNEGSEFRITRARPSMSEKMRSYYWAVVVPTAQETVPEWREFALDQVHEMLKKMFAYFDAWNALTNRVERFGKSVMGEDTTTEEGMGYIDSIAGFLLEKYKVGLGNPDHYKKERDNAELINENKTD